MADRDRDRARSQGGSGATSFGTVYAMGILDYEPNPVPEDDRDLRRYINDELQRVRNVFDELKGESWHVIGDTNEPAFEGTWADAGVDPAFYLDPLGRVHLKGELDTGTSGTTAFTLPEGYRPSEGLYFLAMGFGAAAGNYIHIATNGDVTPTRTGSIIRLNGISFSI